MPFRLIFFGIFLALALPAQSPGQDDSPTTPTATYGFPKAADARLVQQDEVQKMLATHGSDLLVVNFWATWCGPCVEELPYFVKIAREYEESDVRVLGISIDFSDQLETAVNPFLKKNEIPYANLVFQGDAEEMINFFSEKWSGAIPVTFFYNKSGEQIGKFLRPLKYEELKEKIEELRTED